MGKLSYKKGDLFQDPELAERFIVHACNSQGVWGRGFALQCKEKYPELSKLYSFLCKENQNDCAGQAFYLDDEQKMICLITSQDYGDKTDSPEKIIENTVSSLIKVSEFQYPKEKKFISPKFNSGLFNVPWEATEKILKEFVDKNDWDWVVYEPEDK